ncbi:hypothetical protein CDAR_75741 [Caerostris darwini]|uniref:Uncharacterized protein n=1 Tax=Caerostris darwini TaxID=1538125 RepID=A0AAV4W352_9ARAC|nr:hypothetical protein CDAR_75741 [Caerostris darwini]
MGDDSGTVTVTAVPLTHIAIEFHGQVTTHIGHLLSYITLHPKESLELIIYYNPHLFNLSAPLTPNLRTTASIPFSLDRHIQEP